MAVIVGGLVAFTTTFGLGALLVGKVTNLAKELLLRPPEPPRSIIGFNYRPPRDGDGNMRPGRKNARGAGRTKEWNDKGRQKWRDAPLTKKAPSKPHA